MLAHVVIALASRSRCNIVCQGIIDLEVSLSTKSSSKCSSAGLGAILTVQLVDICLFTIQGEFSELGCRQKHKMFQQRYRKRGILASLPISMRYVVNGT